MSRGRRNLLLVGAPSTGSVTTKQRQVILRHKKKKRKKKKKEKNGEFETQQCERRPGGKTSKSHLQKDVKTSNGERMKISYPRSSYEDDQGRNKKRKNRKNLGEMDEGRTLKEKRVITSEVTFS